MANLSLISILVLFLALQSAYQTLISETKKVTKLRVFLQDVLAGDNPTVYVVANCSLSDTQPALFGRVIVMDDLMTATPDPNSAEVGRLQGVVALSDLHEEGLTVLLNLVFTKGKYEGSTISLLGKNSLRRQTREVATVGGMGVFPLATGYVTATTYYSNYTDPDYIWNVYEYNLVVFHYDPAFFSSYN